MSVIQVRSDDGSHVVEVRRDEDEGYATAVCVCRWRTDPDRRDTLHDVIEEAGIHVDGADR